MDLTKYTHAPPPQSFDQTNIISLMLHGAPQLPLLWCFQANNKSPRADPVEVPQGGFWTNRASRRACSSMKHRSMTKEHQRSLEKGVKKFERAHAQEVGIDLSLFVLHLLLFLSPFSGKG